MPPPTEPSPLAWELARSLRLRLLWCFFFRPLLPPPLAGPGEKPVFILERRYQDCIVRRVGSFVFCWSVRRHSGGEWNYLPMEFHASVPPLAALALLRCRPTTDSYQYKLQQ